MESQAIGRIFRLGQERPVTVIRYIMDKSIEEVRYCSSFSVLAFVTNQPLDTECEE